LDYLKMEEIIDYSLLDAVELYNIISYPFVLAFGMNPENMPAIVLVLAIPIFFGIRGFLKEGKIARELENKREAFRNSGKCEIIKNENLREFYLRTRPLIAEVREKVHSLKLKTRDRKKRVKLVEDIEEVLEVIFIEAKTLFYMNIFNNG